MSKKLIGFIKLDRKILKWRWYKDTVVKSVFVHLLLSASFKDTSYKEVNVKSGQVITSSVRLATELGLSRQQVRTALRKLQSTGEITIKATNRYILVTIVKWEDYQNCR